MTVRANEFRNRFGWYMERAAAGETFAVTRRGHPYVRLGPAVEPLFRRDPDSGTARLAAVNQAAA